MAASKSLLLTSLLGCVAISSTALNSKESKPLAPQIQEKQGVQAVQDNGTILRNINLLELGYAQGMELKGLSGSRELYIALPPSSQINNLRLTLPFRSDSAFQSRRSLVIEAEDNVIHTQSLPASAYNGLINVAIDPNLVRNGFLRLKISYAGAITEDRCIDQRISGAYINFGATGGLTATLKKSSVSEIGSIATFMPRNADIFLSGKPTNEQMAAALTLALGGNNTMIYNGASSSQASDNQWRRAQFHFANKNAPDLAVNTRTEIPAIYLGGTNPASTARLLNSKWKSIAGASQAKTAKGQAQRTSNANDITLADLGSNLSVQSFADRGQWNANIPVSAIPAGNKLNGVVIETLVGKDGGATKPVVNVLMNGLMLGSKQAETDGLTRLEFDFPDGIVSSFNDLEVSVTRQTAAGECKYEPQGYPAQLLPSSRLKYGSSGDPIDFFDLASVFNNGFGVVLESANQLPTIAKLLKPLASDDTPISVSMQDAPDNMPYVYVGKNAPEGSSPKVSFDKGDVEIIGENGRGMFDGATLRSKTIAQILEANGETILWIRPGNKFTDLAKATEAPILGSGDIAILSGETIDFALSTERDRLIDIRYPDEFSLSRFVRDNRYWLIAFVWLLISGGFIYLLRRVYAAKKNDEA